MGRAVERVDIEQQLRQQKPQIEGFAVKGLGRALINVQDLVQELLQELWLTQRICAEGKGRNKKQSSRLTSSVERESM